MRNKRFISLMTIFAICASLFANFAIAAQAEETTYIADFKKLVKNGADTMYGTASDIIDIDGYTTANLTYEGTYVTADGKLYIKSGTTCNGNGKYAKGSHISFTAPSDGKLTVSGADIGWFEGETYVGYNAKIEIDAKEDVTYHFGWRKDSTYIESLTFTATAAPSIADGYEAVTDGALPYRVSKPEQAGVYPLVIYLHSAKRSGEDNVSQLNDAKYIFDTLKNHAILVAPQTADVWDANALNALTEELKGKYSPSRVVIAGQDEGADAAYAVSASADKIIPIGGTSNTTAAETSARVWAFANYADANIEKIRGAINSLQSSGADVLYTEFPYSTDGAAAEQASKTAGLTDWILNDIGRPETVDLVLFAGQSNMAGRGDYADAVPVMPYHGFEYHPVTEPGVLTTVSEPFGKYENNNTVNDNSGSGVDRRSGDMVSAFIESYYEASGTPIVGVQCSRGGTGTDYWKGAVLTEAASRYKEAESYLMSAGYTIGRKILVWCQGCTDADKGRTDDSYKSATRAIFNTIKSDTGITNVFMIRIGHCKTSGAAAIDEAKDPVYKRINLAQKALADANDDITAVASFYTDEYAALMRDQYHYHQGAYNSVGKIAGNNAAVTLYNKGEWIKYPEPDEVVETEAPATPEPVDEAFEITSAESSIDVSGMKNYGADAYRVYKADGSYETVTAVNGKISNTEGGEITVVPVYRFNYSSAVKSGYVSARDAYSEGSGYGINGAVTVNDNGAQPENGTLRALVPEGRYDITIARRGQTRFNIKNDDYIIATNNGINNGHQNRDNDRAVMYSPQVLNDDGTIDISISGRNGAAVIETVEIVRVPDKYLKPVVYVAGDSESANYYPNDDIDGDLASGRIMMTGFGMMLPKLLSDDYKVFCLGEPSATIKVWSDNYKDSVLRNIAAGDTILVDFGINERVSSKNRLSEEEMKTAMAELFDEVKKKDAKPILVSPVSCGKYQDRAYFRYVNGTNDMYAFAQEQGVACIDLNKWLELYIERAAQETGASRDDWERNNYHVSDDLHMTQHGALLAASFVAAEMSELGYEIADFSYTYTDISSIGEGNVRGAETENKRLYSVAAAKAFMADGTILKPSPEPTDAPKYPVTITYDAAAKKLTLTASDDTAMAAVIKAAYDGDKMSDVKIYADAAFANGTAAIENIEIGRADKIFVWDSVSDMRPLSTVFTLAPELINAAK